MNQPPRKNAFKIGPFRHKVEMDPQYAEKTWRILEDAIQQVYNHNASGLSFEELYRCGETERLSAVRSGMIHREQEIDRQLTRQVV